MAQTKPWVMEGATAADLEAGINQVGVDSSHTAASELLHGAEILCRIVELSKGGET
jgi:hypothetical protein